MFERDPNTAKIGKEILPFEEWELSEFFQKKAEVELNETPVRQKQGLREIKEKLKGNNLTKDIEFKDDFLLQFLRVKKYNIDKAFTRVNSFLELKRKNPQAFSNYDFKMLEKDKFFTFLPWRCQDGCAIIYIQLDKWNPEEFPLEDVKRMGFYSILQALRNPMTQVNGIKSIYDLKISSLKHLKYVTPQNLYLLVHGCTQCLPGRVKDVHIVNDSFVLKAAWAILKFFLSDKMKKRVLFHSSPEALLKYFPRDILPDKYGGTLKNYEIPEWFRKISEPQEVECITRGIMTKQC